MLQKERNRAAHLILLVLLQGLKGVVGHGKNVGRLRLFVDARAVALLVLNAVEVGNGHVGAGEGRVESEREERRVRARGRARAERKARRGG